MILARKAYAVIAVVGLTGTSVAIGQSAAGQASNGSSRTRKIGPQSRQVDRAVADFPAQSDLSTPEGAAVAWSRANARMDSKALAAVIWQAFDVTLAEAAWSKADRMDLETRSKAVQDGRVVEVLMLGDDFAGVILKLARDRDPYSLGHFARMDGQWKNLFSGEECSSSLDQAQRMFQSASHLRERFEWMKTGMAIASQPALLQDVTRRAVGKTVPEFPAEPGRSTPEGTAVLWLRAYASGDAEAMVDLLPVSDKTKADGLRGFFQRRRQRDPQNAGLLAGAFGKAEILEVLTYGDDVAMVVANIVLPPDFAAKGRIYPYPALSFGRFDGKWASLGEDWLYSPEMAAGKFLVQKQGMQDMVRRPRAKAPTSTSR